MCKANHNKVALFKKKKKEECLKNKHAVYLAILRDWTSSGAKYAMFVWIVMSCGQ